MKLNQTFSQAVVPPFIKAGGHSRRHESWHKAAFDLLRYGAIYWGFAQIDGMDFIDADLRKALKSLFKVRKPKQQDTITAQIIASWVAHEATFVVAKKLPKNERLIAFEIRWKNDRGIDLDDHKRNREMFADWNKENPKDLAIERSLCPQEVQKLAYWRILCGQLARYGPTPQPDRPKET